MTSPCIFCSNGLGVTRDHIPPKAILPKKLHNLHGDLITVPCCENCRKNQNDETIRNILASIHLVEGDKYVEENITPRMIRGFDKSQGRLKKLLKYFEPKTEKEILNDSEGIPLKLKSEVFDTELKPFFDRIGRALLFHDMEQKYFHAQFNFYFDPPLPHEAIEYIKNNKSGKELRATFEDGSQQVVFGYAVMESPKNDNIFILVNLFQGIRLLLHYKRLNNKHA